MNAQSNVTQIVDDGRALRRARGQFVKELLEEDGRSARYVAGRIGLNPTSMSDRLRGKAPFLADELEGIARVLKMQPVEFYARYIAVGPTGLEPMTSTVEEWRLDDEVGRIAPVTSLRTNSPRLAASDKTAVISRLGIGA